MKNSQKEKNAKRVRRIARVRAKVAGTAARPRLAVFRSAKHFSVQLIDDSIGKTLVAASDREVKGKAEAGARKGKIAAAFAVGLRVAEKAKEKGISTAVFDRRSYQYHGRVAAAAEGAREGGLKF